MKGTLLHIIFSGLALILALTSNAQDIHFSQFYQSPFSFNPAMTGDFNGALRFTGNQRTQWRSVTVPYNTWGIAADLKNTFDKNVSSGLSFFTDKAGDSQLKTTMINLAVGKSFIPSSKPLDEFRAGAMIGLTMMSIDYSALQYDNQWNGFGYDPTLQSGEQYARDSRSYLNLHLGALYHHTIDENRSVTGGVGLFNLSSPKQSFFDQAFVRLDLRTTLHVNYLHRLNDDWQLEPMGLLMRQGKFTEFNIGGRAHFTLDGRNWNYEAIYFGALARARDAGNAIVGLRYHQWDVGLSYDINLSSLKPASNGKGGFELGVIYIVPPAPKARDIKKICPDYI